MENIGKKKKKRNEQYPSPVQNLLFIVICYRYSFTVVSLSRNLLFYLKHILLAINSTFPLQNSFEDIIRFLNLSGYAILEISSETLLLLLQRYIKVFDKKNTLPSLLIKRYHFFPQFKISRCLHSCRNVTRLIQRQKGIISMEAVGPLLVQKFRMSLKKDNPGNAALCVK